MMGVMFAGQGMLTTTVEEKSNRVIEVLLSAVSPMQLMGGKLVGHMGVAFLAMSLYLGLGLIVLASFSLFGLLDLTLILYLVIFFLIAFFTLGSLMMAVGSAVNDMREAQSDAGAADHRRHAAVGPVDADPARSRRDVRRTS